MDDKTKPDEGKKTKRIELVKAIRLGMAGMQLDQGDIVAEDKVKPEVFKDLLASGFFKVLLLVAVLAGFAAGPAEAQTSGTNFSYPSFIGKGNAKLDQLPTIFAAEDALFTGVRSGFHSPVADITALKAIAATGATARVDRQLCLVDSGPGSVPTLYVFDSASAAAGDNDLIVAPTAGTGRWIKVRAEVPDNAVTSAKIADGAVAFGDMSLNACTMGQVPAVNAGATAWECSTPTTGDITGVTAATGGGIEGGGSSGSVSIGLLTTCMDNQILKWDTVGSAWGCEADQDTTYANMVGDTGTGGTAGLVPAPAAGDAFAGKYLKADGTWAAPASGGLATSTSVTTATVIGSVTSTRVGSSDGTVAITGTTSSRTGTLHVEITTTGEADGLCRFKYKFGSEVLSDELTCSATPPVALGTTGLSATFTNGAAGGVDSFEDGDDFTSAITWETSLSGFDCGIITIPHMDTPGTGSPGSETVLVHWDATRIASAAVPLLLSTHTSAAGMLAADARATAASEARFTLINWSGGDWSDETGIVTVCRP